MTLSAQCMALRGVSKKLLGAQSTFLPALHYFTKSSEKVIFQRCLSTQSKISPPEAAKPITSASANKDEFITVYKFPFIHRMAMVNKLKLHQTVLFSVVTPLCSVMSFVGYLPSGSGWLVGAVGVLICSALYTLGFFCTNTIGFIYVSVDESTVRIAYIDRWGRRKDDECSSDDIIPVSELPRSFLDPLYLQLRRSDSPSVYKMNVEYAYITDRDRFFNIFGRVDI